MKKALEKYFQVNTEATFTKRDGRLCLVSADKEIRVNTAKTQYQRDPTPATTVISYVNEFLNSVSVSESLNKLEFVSSKI